MLREESGSELIGLGTIHAECVPVVFTDSAEEAEVYRVMLESHGIPAVLDDDAGGENLYAAVNRGVPVLVPEELHEQASELVARERRAVTVLDAFEEEEEEGDDVFEDDDEEEEFEDDDFDDLDDEEEEFDDDEEDDLDVEDE